MSGGGRGLREREPPSFGPMQADLRICFEMLEDGQEPHGNHASEALILHRKISLCVATSRAPVMESSTEQANSGIGLHLLPIAARALYGEVPHERAAVRCLLHNANRSIGVGTAGAPRPCA